MTIDNKLSTAKIRFFYGLMIALSIAIGAYYSFEYNPVIPKPVLLTVLALLILTYSIMLYSRMNYFYLSENGKMLDIKFYSAHPFLRKYKALKLPVTALKSFEHKKSLFDLKQTITLKANTKKGSFIFPSISISALSKTQKNQLLDLLDKYVN